MPRTSRQLEAYCKHAIRNGEPSGQIIQLLLSEGIDADAAQDMLSHCSKAARKPALVMISLGALLALIAGGATAWVWWSTSGSLVFVCYPPVVAGMITFCVGVYKYLSTTRL